MEPIPKIAIVGAGGFVGSRLMHVLRTRPEFRGVAIVRSVKSLARLSDASLEARVVNTAKVERLALALGDCPTVLNAINGDVSRIPAETQAVCEAARIAGCRLLIHLSSAVVFGRVESPEIRDDSPPEVRSWMLYAREKAKAELDLRAAMGKGPMRLVVLRPGLIWGPGSHWVRMVGEQLAHGGVCLSNGGRGIANLIYVDNLVEMILAIHHHASAGSGFYNVADSETVTWQDYYQGIARRMGYSGALVRTWPDSRLPISAKRGIEWCLQQRPLYRTAKWLLPRLGANIKSRLKMMLQGEPTPPGFTMPPRAAAPRLTREQWALQNTVRRLPCDKFSRDYGPVQLVNFEAALDASAAWLRYAGYGAAMPAAGNGSDSQ